MSSEVIAAILGALLAGGFQTFVGILDRKREDEAILVAIASEVDALCRLLRHQNYLQEARELLSGLDAGLHTSANYVVDIRNDYFSVFHSLSSQLGRLRPSYASQIVKFYAYCKTIIDSTRPDGLAALARNQDESIVALRSLIEILTVTLHIGDLVVQMPKRPLVELSLER